MNEGWRYRPELLESRVLVLVGGYGAGKTQIALNLAMQWAGMGRRVALIDLDLVNPYFRSRELAQSLEHYGVEVICPEGDLAYAENPSLGPEIDATIQDRNSRVLIDVGGDENGATVLGRYQPLLAAEDAAILQVVNVFRPFSSTPEEIDQLRQVIEMKSRSKVRGWINNSNLQEWTTIQEWQHAVNIMQELVGRTRIPLAGTSVNPDWAEHAGLEWDPEWIMVQRYLNLGWKQTFKE